MRASFIMGEVWQGLRRNVTMTAAMILTTAISLAMFGGGLLVVQMADKSQEIFLDRVEMQVFLAPEVTADDADCQKPGGPCVTLRGEIEAIGGVDRDNLKFVSQEAALAEAKTRVAPDLVPLIRDSTVPASFRVRMADQASYDAAFGQIRTLAGVDNVLDQRELVRRIFSVLDGARNAAFAIALVMAVAAILLIANTVQMAAYTRRTEVEIMRLVGATRWYTQLPFLLEAVVSAGVGALLAVGGLFVGKALFFDKALADVYTVNILARVTTGDVLFVSPWLVIAGALLAGVTGYATLRFYVRE